MMPSPTPQIDFSDYQEWLTSRPASPDVLADFKRFEKEQRRAIPESLKKELTHPGPTIWETAARETVRLNDFVGTTMKSAPGTLWRAVGEGFSRLSTTMMIPGDRMREEAETPGEVDRLLPDRFKSRYPSLSSALGMSDRLMRAGLKASVSPSLYEDMAKNLYTGEKTRQLRDALMDIVETSIPDSAKRKYPRLYENLYASIGTVYTISDPAYVAPIGKPIEALWSLYKASRILPTAFEEAFEYAAKNPEILHAESVGSYIEKVPLSQSAWTFMDGLREMAKGMGKEVETRIFAPIAEKIRLKKIESAHRDMAVWAGIKPTSDIRLATQARMSLDYLNSQGEILQKSLPVTKGTYFPKTMNKADLLKEQIRGGYWSQKQEDAYQLLVTSSRKPLSPETMIVEMKKLLGETFDPRLESALENAMKEAEEARKVGERTGSRGAVSPSHAPQYVDVSVKERLQEVLGKIATSDELLVRSARMRGLHHIIEKEEPGLTSAIQKELSYMRSNLEEAEPGGRVFREATYGGPPHVSTYPSVFPSWWKKLGGQVSRKDVYTVLDKVEKGKKLTAQQESLYSSMRAMAKDRVLKGYDWTDVGRVDPAWPVKEIEKFGKQIEADAKVHPSVNIVKESEKRQAVMESYAHQDSPMVELRPPHSQSIAKPNSEPAVELFDEGYGSILGNEKGFLDLSAQLPEGVTVQGPPPDIGMIEYVFGSPSQMGHLHPNAPAIARTLQDSMQYMDQNNQRLLSQWERMKGLLKKGERRGKEMFTIDGKPHPVYKLLETKLASEQVAQLPPRIARAKTIWHEIREDVRSRIIQRLKERGQEVDPNWGIEEFFPHLGFGNWRVEGENVPLRFFESLWDAQRYARDAQEIVKKGQRGVEKLAPPSVAISFKGSAPYEGAMLLSRKTYGWLLGNIKEATGLADKEAMETMKGAVGVRKGYRFWGELMKRKGTLLEYEKNLDRVIPYYILHANRWMGIDKGRVEAMKLMEGIPPSMKRLKMNLNGLIDAFSGKPSMVEEWMETSLQRLGLRPWAIRKAQSTISQYWSFSKLGFFNVMSGVTNQTQTIINTLPTLGVSYTKRGLTETLKHWTGQSPRSTKILDDLGISLDQAKNYAGELPFINVNTLRRLGHTSMYFFNKAEFVNRSIAGLGRYYKEIEQMHRTPAEALRIAKDYITRTQFNYSIADSPVFFRNPYTRFLAQFKLFNVKELEFFLTSSATEKMKIGALYVGMTGIKGLPFIYTADKVIEKMTGKSLLDHLRTNHPGVLYGVPSLAGVDIHQAGIDFDWMSTDPSKLSITAKAISLGVQYLQEPTDQNLTRLLRQVGPTQAFRFWDTYNAWERGGREYNPMKRGRFRTTLTPGEMTKKVMGLRPIKETMLSDLEQRAQKNINDERMWKAHYVDRALEAMEKGEDILEIVHMAKDKHDVVISVEDLIREKIYKETPAPLRKIRQLPQGERLPYIEEYENITQGGTP